MTKQNEINRIVKLYDDIESILFSDVSINDLDRLTGINYTTIYRYREGIASIDNMTFNNAVKLLRLKGIKSVDNIYTIRSLVHRSLNNSDISIFKVGKQINVSNLALSQMRDNEDQNIRLNNLCKIYEYYYSN